MIALGWDWKVAEDPGFFSLILWEVCACEDLHFRDGWADAAKRDCGVVVTAPLVREIRMHVTGLNENAQGNVVGFRESTQFLILAKPQRGQIEMQT